MEAHGLCLPSTETGVYVHMYVKVCICNTNPILKCFIVNSSRRTCVFSASDELLIESSALKFIYHKRQFICISSATDVSCRMAYILCFLFNNCNP